MIARDVDRGAPDASSGEQRPGSIGPEQLHAPGGRGVRPSTNSTPWTQKFLYSVYQSHALRSCPIGGAKGRKKIRSCTYPNISFSATTPPPLHSCKRTPL